MIRRTSLAKLTAFSLIVLSFAGQGCTDEDPVTPVAEVGTVMVAPVPAGLDAPWTLAGPADSVETGTGERTLAGRAVGEYTITWGNLADHVTPASETGILAANDTVVFTGTYGPGPGTIVVAPEPVDQPGSTWSITGPDDFTRDGAGPATIDDAAPGDYTIAWGPRAYHVRVPDNEMLTLATGDTVRFVAEYAYLGASTVDECVQLVTSVYEQRDLTGYAGVLSDSFRFITTTGDVQDLDAEIDIAARIFHEIAGDEGVVIAEIMVDEMVPLGPWASTPGDDPYFGDSGESTTRPYGVLLRFALMDQSVGYEVTGMLQLYLAPREVTVLGQTHTIHELLGQRDHTGSQAVGRRAVDTMGMFFDDSTFDAATARLNTTPGEPFDAHVVLLDGTPNTIGVYELGIAFSDDGVEVLSVGGPSGWTNFGDSLNHIVGYSTPLPVSAEGTVLCSFSLMQASAEPASIDLGPSSPSSIPGSPVIVDWDDIEAPLACELFGGGPTVAVLNPTELFWERASLTHVRGLFD